MACHSARWMDRYLERWALLGFPQKIRNSLNRETIEKRLHLFRVGHRKWVQRRTPGDTIVNRMKIPMKSIYNF